MGIRKHVTRRVIDQFHHPSGVYGRVAGRIMATRDTNVGRNRWIAQILEPPPDARILEIGHGPGVAIEALLPTLDGGHVTGLEISPLMSRTAARRNRRAVAEGRVRFVVGDGAQPPADLRDLDLVYAFNAHMFWDDPASALAELSGRLRPGGEIVLAYMPPPTATETAPEVAAELADLFATVGMVDIRHDERDGQPPAIATRGRRPAEQDL